MAFYPTLNEALETADATLVALFPAGYNLSYGQTFRFVRDGVFVYIYRDERGMYEEAVMYYCKCGDFVSIVF